MFTTVRGWIAAVAHKHVDLSVGARDRMRRRARIRKLGLKQRRHAVAQRMLRPGA
jgi:hypothetical protein